MTAPTTATAVANAFLEIQEADKSEFPLIDQMKIQKLVYYAHAWWLAYNGQPLFEDDIEAWPWGPVVRNVYNAFKNCGRRPIRDERAADLVKTDASPFGFSLKPPPKPSEQVMEFLNAVWESHKGMTGVQLSNATHAPKEPWTIVRENYGSLDGKPTIPNDLIEEVFRSKLAADK